MKKIVALLMAFILLVALVGSVAARQDSAPPGAGSLTITLTGIAEVPGPGDPDGAGTATLTFDPDAGTICVDSSYTNIALPVTGAHIHEAPLGVSGSIVVPFIGAGGSVPPADTESLSGCAQVDADRLSAIWQNPSDYYFNLHNAEYPAGAIRGQLAE